ncbi:MAG: hypothetical protein K2X86_10080 [Cytophagaceae bacterium]|nr:hypothetical protein [Cytophagaceae bacterium]
MLLLVFAGCKRTLKDAEFFGPEVISAPDDFVVTGFAANVDSIDFAGDTLYFTAAFNHYVSWTLTLTGQESDAEKKIQGASQLLDAANTSWKGESDNLFIFKKNEKIIARLTFFGTTYSVPDTIVVKKEKNYPGILITDFEGNGMVPSWTTFWTAGKLISKGEENTLHPPQGNFYFHMRGDDFNGGTGVGGMNHSPLGGGYGLSGSPTQIYLNMYLYGIPNTRIDFRIFESDGDAYTAEQLITWSGWRLISIPYSDFQLTSTSQTNGQNPELANEMMFLLKSSPAGNVVEADLDYIIFTNTPFEP